MYMYTVKTGQHSHISCHILIIIIITAHHVFQLNLGVLNKSEQKTDEMLDITEYAHKAVPGHQDSESVNDQPVRTAFEGDYLTFERVKQAQTSKRNGRKPSKRLAGLIARTAEFHNQAELLKVRYD